MKRSFPHYDGTRDFIAFGFDGKKGNEIFYDNYHIVKFYKSITSAVKYNTRYAYKHLDGDEERPGYVPGRTGERGERAPLVLRFRPDDLEPANIPFDELVVFYKAQVEKWQTRLLESGLSIHERVVYCENAMLSLDGLMKKFGTLG